MKKVLIVICVFFSFLSLSFTVVPSHQHNGTSYGDSGVEAYAHNRHGIDGSLFLDPFFLPFFENAQHLKFLDAGCGAGPWSILAAKNGANVYGVDIQEGMIDLAKKAALQNEVADSISFYVGSVANLNFQDNYFDRAISINVGCNLPSDVFHAHFQELFRALKSGGKAIITAPTSFDVIFTKDQNRADIKKEIDEILLHDLSDEIAIRKNVNRLHSILRATFVIRDGQLILVKDEKQLVEGEPIWRKIPGLVVPNFYHSEKEYIKEIIDAGFRIDQIDRPQFKNWDEWKKSERILSKEYIYYPAFIIIHFTKP